jgi:hypothetical protein
MDGSEWLDEVRRRISERLPEAEASRPEPETLTLSAGLRVIVLHDAGDVVLFSPSFVAGGSIGSRLQDRVQHLDITSYGINEATVDVAVDAVLGHLRA